MFCNRSQKMTLHDKVIDGAYQNPSRGVETGDVSSIKKHTF